MKRRSFLKGVAAIVAAATIPVTLGRADAFETKVTVVEIDTEDGWVPIEMGLLKRGDVFRVRENGVTVMPSAKAGGSPYIVQEGLWGVQVYGEQKKKTVKSHDREGLKYAPRRKRNVYSTERLK